MKRGWCPTVHAPMPTGDGLLIRIKPFGGRLDAAALRTLADVAGSCGNNVVELTSRGNVQLRGLSRTTVRRAAAILVDSGLADPDPNREASRNVIAMPPWDDAAVSAIEAMLMRRQALSSKFCVTVGGLSRAHHEAQRAAEYLMVGLPLGQTDSRGLLRLADLIHDAVLRTTPWRSFYLGGSWEAASFADAGFATDRSDARLNIAACTGSPGCSFASVRTRDDATYLISLGITGIHLSGCDKGCACDRPAATLVGRNGSYDLIRHGRASDRPDVRGVSIAQAAEMLA